MNLSEAPALIPANRTREINSVVLASDVIAGNGFTPWSRSVDIEINGSCSSVIPLYRLAEPQDFSGCINQHNIEIAVRDRAGGRHCHTENRVGKIG